MYLAGEGIEDPNRLFLYLNLVGNRADKVRSLAGLYKALGLKKREKRSVTYFFITYNSLKMLQTLVKGQGFEP